MRVLLLPLLLAACGDTPAKPEPKPRCNSAATPLRAVVPEGTRCLEFPEAEVGVGSFARLELVNDATEDRAFTLKFSDGFQLQAGPTSVPACGSVDLNLEFFPRSAGAAEGKLTVTSCDACDPLTACLKGTAVPRR